ncbi:hypothetical protein J0H58_22370 [bacterium]|nr:hypothetical protein [bacterium]
MTRIAAAVLTAGFVTAAVATAQPDDAKAARALVDKAIKAHGGAENVAKFKASVTGFKGTFHGMGVAVPMTGEISIHAAERLKVDIEIEAGGQKFPFVSVVNKDKGWVKIAGDVKEMGKDEVAEARENLHTGWVASLAPLVSGKGYTLATAGELLVDDKAALGVKVSAKGRRDVTLYFDKETGLLARYDSTVKDEGSGREVAEETTPGEYKDVQGTKQAAKFVVRRDGKLHMEGEATSHTLSEALDAGGFARP